MACFEGGLGLGTLAERCGTLMAASSGGLDVEIFIFHVTGSSFGMGRRDGPDDRTGRFSGF